MEVAYFIGCTIQLLTEADTPMFRKCCAVASLTALVLTGCGGTSNLSTPGTYTPPATTPTPVTVSASTAIQHVVVIFGENVSFDHYFGTYPNAANVDGTTFTAASGTPTPVNYTATPALLTSNPNLNAANGVGATNPFRLGHGQAATGDQDHNYNPEQLAFDNGKMDLFPMSVGTADGSLTASTGAPAITNTTGLTMGYYDGNTVTAMWNYAQHYAMNDHSFGGTFGPSTPGALELAAGQTNGVTYTVPYANIASSVIPDGQGGYTDINDDDPAGDICSSTTANFSMTGKNIGDLLNTGGITWGFFEGGFNLSTTNTNGTTGCARSTVATYYPGTKADYIPHHQPFQYWASTANPNHNRPTPGVAIGAKDAAGANHQYDTADFNAALTAATPTMAQVSFLKAPGYQDAHAGYSDPLDEQTFIVNEINLIQQSPFWQNTAIIIAYDDSDGWYDHLADIVSGSTSSSDAASCNNTIAGSTAPAIAATTTGPGSNGQPVLGRCGKGPRLPLLVISPYAKKNFVDTTPTEQASIPRFIEDVFLGSQRIGTGSFDTTAGSIMNMFNFTTTSGVAPNPNVVLLNPTTGAVTSGN
jgi:phospholipase C